MVGGRRGSLKPKHIIQCDKNIFLNNPPRGDQSMGSGRSCVLPRWVGVTAGLSGVHIAPSWHTSAGPLCKGVGGILFYFYFYLGGFRRQACEPANIDA